MRHIILLLASLSALLSYADLQGDGYYRVQNVATSRIAYLLDNQSKIDAGATKIDLSAIELWMGEEKALSDLSTILYIEKAGSEYDIKGQGSSVHEMAGRYLCLLKKSGTNTYYAYGRESGAAKYLGDPGHILSKEQSFMSDQAPESGNYRLWYLKPIETESDNYVGFAPTLKTADSYYAPIYFYFPFTPKDPAMKAYYISKVDKKNAVAVYEEITGTVPGASGIFVKCVSDNPADNKINLATGSYTLPSQNLLKGAYFENDRANHVNRIPNDKATMRFLTASANGKLFMSVSDVEYVPRNTSYLLVDKDAPADLRLVTPQQYQDILAGIDNAVADETVSVNGHVISNPQALHIVVYTLMGNVAYNGNASQITLPSNGIYILRTPSSTRKIVVR